MDAPPNRKRWLRTQDIAWILFVTVLLATSEENYNATILLILIGLFQILEPRLAPFSTRRGQVASLALKLVLCYLLLGWSHTIYSPFQSIFFLPVVSAATTLELGWVLLVALLASASYFSFLLPVYIDWQTFELPPGYLSLMCLRITFFFIVAFIVYEQAKAKRDEMERTAEAARQLADSNRNLRKAEVSLRRSERLAALGQLTAGLAHELRNPLGTIRASAEMMTKQPTQLKAEVMGELAGYIRSEADRMNGLVGHFLDFARPLQIHPADADLQAVIHDVVKEQSATAATCAVDLRTEVTGDLHFQFDPELLRLALSNLTQNAIQASAEGARVTIVAEEQEGEILVEVKDTGAGIDPKHLESIFNPFFTTKPQGTGLGLAIVAKIVDEHGGRIHTVSTPGEGTTFVLTLPKEQQS